MAKINAKVKGKTGEQEIAARLNEIIEQERRAFELLELEHPQVQRNQNQSAVGGCDLIGTYEFAIEIKRQEKLQLDKWFDQAASQAARYGMKAILIYRQNRRPWRVRMLAAIEDIPHVVLVDVSLEDFESRFRERVRAEYRRLSS